MKQNVYTDFMKSTVAHILAASMNSEAHHPVAHMSSAETSKPRVSLLKGRLYQLSVYWVPSQIAVWGVSSPVETEPVISVDSAIHIYVLVLYSLLNASF
jgi:hypothetical protein